MATDDPPVKVRLFEKGDRTAVLALSHRLTAGVAPWREAAAVASAVSAWVNDSLDQPSPKGPVFVAVAAERLLGFVTAGTRRHWSGDVDAYVGELVVAADATGQGVGRLLMAAAEDWARGQGHRRLTLETGAGNGAALNFYRALGYDLEEVVLSRDLSSSPG